MHARRRGAWACLSRSLLFVNLGRLNNTQYDSTNSHNHQGYNSDMAGLEHSVFGFFKCTNFKATASSDPDKVLSSLPQRLAFAAAAPSPASMSPRAAAPAAAAVASPVFESMLLHGRATCV